ncbi:MAG: hypothetical protein KAR12_01570 [Methylococcales bacterium]|nr:hypothetical protein [Methylococcales bacterium]
MKEIHTLNSSEIEALTASFSKIRFAISEPEASIHKNVMRKALMVLSVLFVVFVLPSTANAHRGARNEPDTCRFSVGDEVIHFSAYTPSFSGGKSYCHGIPYIGLTDLVFDYEGKKLRNTSVEFEITKEPEGTRIYYHKPEKIKKGSVDAKVDFAKFGAGDYLAHVTILYQGEKLDSHLPFSIGVDAEDSGLPFIVKLVLIILAIAIISMVIMSRITKKQSTSADEPD